jgi:hypothetical protein
MRKKTRRLSRDYDRRKAAAAISLATGKRVRKVVLISASRPFPKPEWMSADVYGRTVREGLRDSLRDSSWADLWFNFDGKPDHEFREAFTDFIHEMIGSSIEDEKEKARRLAPLIQMLQEAIPLGEKADEKDVWIVLVA